ncbi:diguanylate cyclase [Comamonas testosteroni]|uniref:GGDEF domain-containing protein n=1 Tax=Comamonas testosteroni TaxID=285 RepID=UPI002DB77AD5|nr:diguanylate cyclase [Comamonas testosteroni]MEB5966684.1 diguanylate cyclase [Comamonas testosteroni]
MSEASPPKQTPLLQTAAPHAWVAALALGGMVFLSALLGILGRPLGFLSAIWPANALLLGLLLHKPGWLRPSSVLAVSAGYIAADLLTGSRLDVAVLLSMANMAGVGTAWALMHRQSRAALFMQRQSSALLLFVGSGMGALAAAILGGSVVTAVFGTPHWQAFSMWLSSEWLNYMTFLPIVLALPTRKQPVPNWTEPSPLRRVLPLLSVIALEAISHWIKGPGSLAFSLPALIWCALSYRIFSLTMITATLCLSRILFATLGTLEFTPDHFLESLSFRIGLCMLVLGPLAVAGSHMARNELMQKLSHAVNHDFLTDVLARGAFMKQGQRILERCRQDEQPFAILMLDLDHFKQINDSFGHAGGDQLLRSFCQTLTQVLRAQDIVGRMGGEEFAVALPRVDASAAQEIARRINRAIRELRVPMDDQLMSATVSIGLIHVARLQTHHNLDLLLQEADQVLYDAKAAGRDRVRSRLC